MLILLLGPFTVEELNGQVPRRRARPEAHRRVTQVNDANVTISYPDGISLATFVDYVSQTLDKKIVYGDEVKNQIVILRPSEVQVPRDQLLDLLRSMLRMNDLALIESDVSGWLRIVRTDDVQRHVADFRYAEDAVSATSSNRLVTQIVRIESDDLAGIVKHVQRFLSSAKASVIEVPDKSLLIITDYESAVARALEIIELVDAAPGSTQIVAVPVRHFDPKTVAEAVRKLLEDKAKLEQRHPPSLVIQPDLANESVLLIGAESDVVTTRALIERFDVPPRSAPYTDAYSPQHMSASRLRLLIESTIVSQRGRDSATTLLVDEDRNRLFVTASVDIHEGVAKLLKDEDVPFPETSRPLRIYRPKNRRASEIITVLSDVLPSISVSTSTTVTGPAGLGAADDDAPPGPNRPPGPPAPVQEPPTPPALEPIETPTESSETVRRIEGDDFVVSVDEHTNSIIAIGPNEFHANLKSLMLELDKRQPQVLIEMTLVAITFNDSMSIAMELTNEEKDNGFQSLLFSSFGLSDIDLMNGVRAFSPGGGINALLVGPHETPFLMRAIAAHGNSKVIATPRILVASNETGTISSVEEAPFTSINASDTVATTSFAGFESAGTTLTVSPHIAEGDHLTLNYSFSFSNFTGSGSVGVPPPRTTNSFTGTIDVPDQYTAIVGGLVSDNETDSVTEVPLLGRLPILGVFFQSSDRARTKSRVYAFIRPVILRDDKFADLRQITRRELDRAEIRDKDFPESTYLWMR